LRETSIQRPTGLGICVTANENLGELASNRRVAKAPIKLDQLRVCVRPSLLKFDPRLISSPSKKASGSCCVERARLIKPVLTSSGSPAEVRAGHLDLFSLVSGASFTAA